MKRTKQSILLLVISVFCCSAPVRSQENRLSALRPNSLSLIINSGGLSENEKGMPYNDPQFLKNEGYTATVINSLGVAINYDNFQKNIIKKGSLERKWIDSTAVAMKKQLHDLKSSGLEVYTNMDFLVFPVSIFNKYGKEIQGQNPEGKVEHDAFGGSKQRPDIQQEITKKILIAQIDGIFTTFPEADGIISRFGETYLHGIPYHRGNSPIKDTDYQTAIKDQITMLTIMREEICVKRNKKLIFRTWSFGNGFHNNLRYYLDVTNTIPPHKNLIFSIKYPQDDFHRICAFNPCLGIGKHQQIFEAQSAMEAYGKGAHPYYTASGVIDGFPENRYMLDNWSHKMIDSLVPAGTKTCIRDVLKSGLINGAWTWSKGGGWQGPSLKHTFWNDLNSYVISHWAQDTTKTEEQLCYEYFGRFGIKGFNAAILRKIAVLSIEAVRKGQLSDYTKNSVWWARDNFFSASYNNETIKEILSDKKEKRVLAEKAEASAMWLQMEQLSNQLILNDKELEEMIRVSCTYGRIKYQLTEQMWYLMIQNGKLKQAADVDKSGIRQAIARYDALWKEWQELAKSPWCASLYKDLAFYDERKGSIGELVDRLRGI